MVLDREVLQKLEFYKVIEIFLRETRSEPGAQGLNRVVPFENIEKLHRAQARVAEYMNFRNTFDNMPWNDNIASLSPLLEKAHRNGFLRGVEIIHFRELLTLSQKIRSCFLELRENYPEIWENVKKIRDFSPEIEGMSCLNDDGTLLDSASPKLAEIRGKIYSTRRKIRERANAIFSDPRSASALQDRTLNLRNGRYVLAVRLDSYSRFHGIVQDRSGTGNTVFMEPNNMIELNNALAFSLSAEKEEETRILREITTRLLSRENAVSDAENALGIMDMTHAITEVIFRGKWNLPQLTERNLFELHNVIHPLLTVKPVPVDISCGDGFRILVITGPNTGGKTVALKTAALSVILAWHGFPIPAGEQSRVGVFSNVFIDAGDEQSIEQNLSTFSSHVENLIYMLKKSDRKSLLLLDELGAGTDPQEGAALGIAILETLKDQGCCTLATTHHNPVKSYAISEKGIQTASMEFDVKTLAPTYRMLLGVPGKSNALDIAERLGMPPEVISRARNALSSKEASLEDVIGELNEKKAILESRSRKLDEQEEYNRKLLKEINAGKNEFNLEKERILQENIKKADEIIQRAEERARELIKELEGASRAEGHRAMARHKKKRSRVEKESASKGKTRAAISQKTEPLGPGSYVRVSGSGVKGEIIDLKAGKATIQAGPLKVQAPVNELEVINYNNDKGKHKKETSQAGSVKISRPSGVPSSLMVRGMTLSEAIPMVESYLDRAMRAGYSSVCVIHGRGEGILRREVHKICSGLSYVDSCRLGEQSEGGYGVTIVNFSS